MKKISLFLATLAINLSLFGQGTAPVETSTGSWVLTTSVASQFMFRGTRLGGPALQPSIEYDAGNLGLGLWVSTPLKDKVVGQSDPETDLYGFYNLEVSKNVSVVPGFTLYHCPRAKKNDGFYKTTFEPSLALSCNVSQLKLTPKVYYDMVMKGPTAELTGAFAVPLKEWGTELDFSATAGTFIWKDYIAGSSPDTKNWGDYYLVGVVLPYQIAKDSKVSLGWSYTKGSNNYLKQGTDAKTLNSAALGRGVLTINYIVTF